MLNDLLLVRRYVLPTVTIHRSGKVKTLHAESGSVKFNKNFLEPRDSRVFVSDIEILSKLQKKADYPSGFDCGDWYMEPLPYGILTALDSILKCIFFKRTVI